MVLLADSVALPGASFEAASRRLRTRWFGATKLRKSAA